MNLITKSRGHVVYSRCPTSPPLWEAACECGYRSDRFPDEAHAIQAGVEHAANAPVFHAPKPKKTKRGR